ncbi:hypothetical protein P168DRAFT_313786 [Aspergillus campestris IBT 28561]|uniref:Senescence-associated protein n=1 Tax=Aspergillus campestris (strain IBT 28561) TaxID=1392248 RepID=A0A2I1CQ73_ASPC2|nr:hypothetical protein P168DRAFT_313786 [Aspergillus campestris IBT 28561]
MIGRADIEGSKSNVAMNAWLPQASYPCGHTFMVCIHTENQNQGDFYPFVLLEISVLHESPLGHLRCVVFHWRRSSHLFYTPYVFSQCQTRVKLNRVFFPADSAKPVPLAVVSLDSR